VNPRSGPGRIRFLSLAALWILGGCLLAFSQPEAALTVEQAVARATANQPLIRQAEAAVEAARARIGEAQSVFYPNLQASASYSRVEPLQAFTFDLGALLHDPLIPPLSLSLYPEDNVDFHVGASQLIFQFGKQGAQVKLAESGMNAARIGLEQIKQSLAFQAVQGFYTVLFAQEQVKILSDQLENLQLHLKIVQEKMDTGSATKLEVLSTQFRIAGLQSERLDAQSRYEQQAIGLKQLLGLDPEAELELQGSLTPGQNAPDPQTFTAAALEQRPEVRQAMEAENAAQLARRLAVSGYLPTLSAHASLGYRNGLLPNVGALTFNWAAGVQMNVPIFDGLLTARQVQEADQKLIAAKANTAAVRRTIVTQVLQALEELTTRRQQVETSLEQLQQAQAMLEIARTQYEIGVTTNLEYLDAQASLQTARLTNLSTAYREILSEYALRQAAGESIWKLQAAR
jgi:outer membrane protein